MVIKKLNSLFHKHGRWLFCIITVVIIIAFMDFLTPGSGLGSGCSLSGPEKLEVGTAFGRPVTYGELRDVQRNLQIAFELIYNSSVRELKPEQLFGYRCMEIKAQQLGITASDKEVAARIKMLPNFQTKGNFDLAKYKKALAGMARFGVAEKDLYNALRMMIVSEKLQTEMASGIVATPGEVAELYRQANTSYEAQVAEFAMPNPAVKAVKINALSKNEQLKLNEFFQKNARNYSITGHFDTLLVAFPFSDFRSAAAKMANVQVLKQFYKNNLDRFKDKKGKTLSFDLAKNEAAKLFVEDQAKQLALTAADEFAIKAGDAISNAETLADQPKIFRKHADALKKVVIEANKVALDATSVGQIKSPELMRALLAVAGNPVAQVVAFDGKAYVGLVYNRVENRPAQLAEVTAQVYRDMKAQEAYKAAQATLNQELKKLQQAPAAQRAKLFKQLKATFKELKFSAMKQGAPELMRASFKALTMAPGEVQAVPEQLQLVLLTKRIPADMKALKGQEKQYESMVKMQKMQRAIAAFQEELSAKCRFNSKALER